MVDFLNALTDTHRRIMQGVVVVVGVALCAYLIGSGETIGGVAVLAAMLLGVLSLQPNDVLPADLTAEQENEIRSIMADKGDTDAVIRVRELTGAKMKAAYEAVRELRPDADGHPA